jgi:hypothetical protein
MIPLNDTHCNMLIYVFEIKCNIIFYVNILKCTLYFNLILPSYVQSIKFKLWNIPEVVKDLGSCWSISVFLIESTIKIFDIFINDNLKRLFALRF